MVEGIRTIIIRTSEQILRRDVTPQFIVMELLSFLRQLKIMRPGYTTLQVIVSKALNAERDRFGSIIRESLTEANKSDLQTLLFEEETETFLAQTKLSRNFLWSL